MQRAARTQQIFFVEDPLHAVQSPHFRTRIEPSGATVLTPVFDQSCDALKEQKALVSGLIRTLQPSRIETWFYTPMALRIAGTLRSDLTVYYCMDELSAFRFAPPELADEAGLARPRVGYFGGIDKRMDLTLVAQVAAAMPDVQFVMLGPVVKVSHEDLPKGPNLHWRGRKEYGDLLSYMANWQAAWLPFAMSESTRFISPTKTPEFLVPGLPVTSTPVPDVVADWGKAGLVRIPIRTDRDDRYFTDQFQAMPDKGYTAMFARMPDHPQIKLRLGTDWMDLRDQGLASRVIFTGPINEYFDHCYGRLPYRSPDFVQETQDLEWAQPVAVVNFPQNKAYTRITEYKHLTGQSHPKTSLSYEYPADTGEPYYPIPRPENQALYRQYKAAA